MPILFSRPRSKLRQVGWRVLAALALLIASLTARAEAAPVSVPAAGPPIPPGEARVWFYRTFFPGDTPGMPAVAMNGQVVGYARAGWSFYRDVPADTIFHVTVASFGQDTNQAKDIRLAPGTQIYLAIQSDPTMIESFWGYRRGTYYVWVESLQTALIHLEQTSFGTGY